MGLLGTVRLLTLKEIIFLCSFSPKISTNFIQNSNPVRLFSPVLLFIFSKNQPCTVIRDCTIIRNYRVTYLIRYLFLLTSFHCRYSCLYMFVTFIIIIRVPFYQQSTYGLSRYSCLHLGSLHPRISAFKNNDFGDFGYKAGEYCPNGDD